MYPNRWAAENIGSFFCEFGQIENTFWNFPTFKGTGYVGIGWRPKSATKQCQAYPKLYDKETAAKSLWLDNEKKQGKSAEPEAGEFNKSQRNKIFFQIRKKINML